MKLNNSVVKLILSILMLTAVGVIVYFSFPWLARAAGYLVNLFLPFILGYIFSVLVNPLASFLQKRLKIPRGMSAVLVMILILGVAGGLVTFVIIKIVEQVRNLYDQFPLIYQNIMNGIEYFKTVFAGVYKDLPLNLQTAISEFGTGITNKMAIFINTKSSPVVASAGTIAKALPRILIGVIVFILSSFFMVSDPSMVSALIRRICGEKLIHRMYTVQTEIKRYLGGYFKAQVTIMSIVFVILFAGLTIFGIEYALLIALGIAMLDALPFFGSGAVLWPWALINFLSGNWKMGLSLMALYVCIVLVRQFIEPKIVSTNIGMNSLYTLMSMYIGYKTLSIGGMIIGPVVLMLLISFYRAGLFDGLIRGVAVLRSVIKKDFYVVKEKIKTIWEN